MRHKVIRDAVHGDIVLSREHEIPILDTPEVQRLRGIKQLGMAYFVFPSAVHTRFEHSLGTCWLTKRIISSIEEQQKGVFSDEQKCVMSCAALLHDISHIPFGHTLEDERRVFARHDNPRRIAAFLSRGMLGKKLKELGLLLPVSKLLTESAKDNLSRELISGTICADLLDYLARDTFFCGISTRYDSRIFSYFRFGKEGLFLEAQKDGIIREDALSEIINLLRIRYFMSERVYFHHAKAASGAMLSKCVEYAVGNGLKEEDLYHLTDEGLISLLFHRFHHLRPVARILENLASRHLYKRCYILTRRIGEERQREFVQRYHLHPEQRREAEEILARKMHIGEGEIIIYCPAAEMSLKEADCMVRIDQGLPRILADLAIPEIRVLQEKHKGLWRFYVFVNPDRLHKMKDLSRACEDFFCEANHLPALQSGQMFLGL